MSSTEGEECRLTQPCQYCNHVYRTYINLPLRNSTEEPVQILLHNLKNYPDGYDVNLRQETVADLILFIQSRDGIPPCQQLLSSGGKILDDPSKYLSEYPQIESSRNIHLSFRHRAHLTQEYKNLLP